MANIRLPPWLLAAKELYIGQTTFADHFAMRRPKNPP
jgi:hypothetical protein